MFVIKDINSSFHFCFMFFILWYNSHRSYAQSELQTTKYRNMVIDLGNGLETNARLNLPAVGDGPLSRCSFGTGFWNN